MELRVKEICKEKGILFKDLADKIGVTDVGLRKQVQGNPTIGTLEKIANALNVDITALFDKSDEINGYIELNGIIHKVTSKEDIKKLAEKL